MGLVKLTNIGEESFEGIYDSKVYQIDPDKDGNSYVIIEENIAKHWLGDWSLTDEESKEREKRRISMLHRADPKYKIIVTPVRVEVRKDEVNPYRPEPVVVNPNVLIPEEAEFAELEELKEKEKPIKKTPKN